MITIKNLRIERQPPEYFCKEEIQGFFAQEMHTAYRNAFMVFLHTCMGFEELTSLRFEDIDLTIELIYVRPKDEDEDLSFNKSDSNEHRDAQLVYESFELQRCH